MSDISEGSSGPTINVATYGAVADAHRVDDAITTSGSPTVTSAGNNFRLTDIGKQINIYDITNGYYIFQGTVLNVTSTGSITLSGNAADSDVTGKSITWIGTDNSTALNNALTAAGNMVPTDVIDVNHPTGSGQVTVLFPVTLAGAAYLFNSTLNVPTNVVINADAMLVSNVGTAGTTNTVQAMNFSPGGSILKLQMDCQGGNGIIMGSSNTQSHAFIQDLTLWEVGNNASQYALTLQGNDWQISRFWTKGGYYGLYAAGADDILFDKLYFIGCYIGAWFYDCEQVIGGDIQCDTNLHYNIQLDACHSIQFKCNAFYGPVSYGLILGTYSSAPNRNVFIEYTGQRHGGVGVYVNYVMDSTIICNLTNSALFNAGGTAITAGIQYAGNTTGTMTIIANVDTNITTLVSGSVYGNLLINGQLQNGTLTTAGSLTGGSASSNFFNLTGTLPSTLTAAAAGAFVNITGAGSSGQQVSALQTTLNAGWTGGASSMGIQVTNNSAGTNTGIYNQNGNFALQGYSTGSTSSGYNYGIEGRASNAFYNIGLYGRCLTASNSGANIGVIGFARNTGTSPIEIGGYFGMPSGEPSWSSSWNAALVADNGAESANSAVFLALVNGTMNFEIDKKGHIVTGGTAPTIAAQTALGSTGTATIAGTDVAGTITLTPGGTGITTGAQAIITFANAYTSAPKVVKIDPANANAQALTSSTQCAVIAANNTTTTWQVNSGSSALSTGTAYEWTYLVIG